jgi:hypothetical protein
MLRPYLFNAVVAFRRLGIMSADPYAILDWR